MSIISVEDLAVLQADEESQMLDACLIERPNPADWTGAKLTVYTGKCEVDMLGRATSDELAAGMVPTDPHRCRVKIPVAAGPAKFDDHVTITASINPALVELDVFVTDIPTVSLATAQRLLCQRKLT